MEFAEQLSHSNGAERCVVAEKVLLQTFPAVEGWGRVRLFYPTTSVRGARITTCTTVSYYWAPVNVSKHVQRCFPKLALAASTDGGIEAHLTDASCSKEVAIRRAWD